MQKKCLQKTQQKPKTRNFQKWVFANPARLHITIKIINSIDQIDIFTHGLL